MLSFTQMISSASRGFPQWVELRCNDRDKLHPLWPLPPAVSGQRPASRVPAAAAGAGRAEARGGGPGTRRMALLSRAFRTTGDNRGS